MKKANIFCGLMFCFALSFMFSCSKPEIKNCKAYVTEVNDNGIAVTTADGEKLLVNIDKARLVDGMCMATDSIDLSYIYGRNDSVRAVIIEVIQKPGHVIDLEKDTTSVLVTK